MRLPKRHAPKTFLRTLGIIATTELTEKRLFSLTRRVLDIQTDNQFREDEPIEELKIKNLYEWFSKFQKKGARKEPKDFLRGEVSRFRDLLCQNEDGACTEEYTEVLKHLEFTIHIGRYEKYDDGKWRYLPAWRRFQSDGPNQQEPSDISYCLLWSPTHPGTEDTLKPLTWKHFSVNSRLDAKPYKYFLKDSLGELADQCLCDVKEPGAVVVLHGFPGVGKGSVAWKVCNELSNIQESPYSDGVVQLDCIDKSASQIMSEALDFLSGEHVDGTAYDQEHLLTRYLELLNEKQALISFTNLNSAENATLLLPKSEETKCSFLVSSIRKSLASTHSKVNPHEVKGCYSLFDLEEIWNRLGLPDLELGNLECLNEIRKKLDSNALALTLLLNEIAAEHHSTSRSSISFTETNKGVISFLKKALKATQSDPEPELTEVARLKRDILYFQCEYSERLQTKRSLHQLVFDLINPLPVCSLSFENRSIQDILRVLLAELSDCPIRDSVVDVLASIAACNVRFISIDLLLRTSNVNNKSNLFAVLDWLSQRSFLSYSLATFEVSPLLLRLIRGRSELFSADYDSRHLLAAIQHFKKKSIGEHNSFAAKSYYTALAWGISNQRSEVVNLLLNRDYPRPSSNVVKKVLVYIDSYPKSHLAFSRLCSSVRRSSLLSEKQWVEHAAKYALSGGSEEQAAKVLRDFSWRCGAAGFSALANEYWTRAIDIDGDTRYSDHNDNMFGACPIPIDFRIRSFRGAVQSAKDDGDDDEHSLLLTGLALLYLDNNNVVLFSNTIEKVISRSGLVEELDNRPKSSSPIHWSTRDYFRFFSSFQRAFGCIGFFHGRSCSRTEGKPSWQIVNNCSFCAQGTQR